MTFQESENQRVSLEAAVQRVNAGVSSAVSKALHEFAKDVGPDWEIGSITVELVETRSMGMPPETIFTGVTCTVANRLDRGNLYSGQPVGPG